MAVPGDAALPGEVRAGRRRRTVDFLFGPVTVERECYHDPVAGTCRMPFDDALGLVRGVTPAVAARVARRAGADPFKEASGTLADLAGLRVSPDRVRTIAQSLRASAEDFQDRGIEADATVPAFAVVEVDGKGVPLRRGELAGVRGKGEDGTARTREVKAGAIFTFTPNPGEEDPPERDANSTTYRLSAEKANDFGRSLWGEFEKRFPGEPPPTLFISDAAAGILAIRENWFPFAIGIIDFHHAAEHLGKVLDACGMREKTEERDRMYGKWRGWLLAGRARDIMVEARGLGEDGKAVDKSLRYFEEGEQFMKYAEYRAKGWFIGSGVIEAACKNVVAKRFCSSGMFWSGSGLDAMLPLRAIIKSGRYVEFWKYTLRGKRQIRCA